MLPGRISVVLDEVVERVGEAFQMLAATGDAHAPALDFNSDSSRRSIDSGLA
jgi:hypothetical protein